jgi:hypothetical protein
LIFGFVNLDDNLDDTGDQDDENASEKSEGGSPLKKKNPDGSEFSAISKEEMSAVVCDWRFVCNLDELKISLQWLI